MKLSFAVRSSLQWAGSVLAIMAVAFVAMRMYDYQSQMDYDRFGVVEWSGIIAFALIYGAANLLLAIAWWCLLYGFGLRISRRWALRTYGISQLAKYVPGNIFHLAGRQAMGMGAGLPAWALAKSNLLELAVLSSMGGLFGFLVLPLLLNDMSGLVGITLFVSVLGVVLIIVKLFFGWNLVYALSSYVAFLAVSGSVFVGLVALVSPASDVNASLWLPLAGAFVIAWLAGLVTPGAPAGVGVREVVLLFLLKAIVVESDLVLAIILGRLITVAGDAIFFLASLLLRSGENPG